jgi:hypothetical protein
MPASFSVNKISLGPKKAILVGYLNPFKTASTLRWGSTTTGPWGEGRPTSEYFGVTAFTI